MTMSWLMSLLFPNTEDGNNEAVVVDINRKPVDEWFMSIIYFIQQSRYQISHYKLMILLSF